MVQGHKANNIPGLSSMTQLTVSQDKLPRIESKLDTGSSLSHDSEIASDFAPLSQASSISLAPPSNLDSPELSVESQTVPSPSPIVPVVKQSATHSSVVHQAPSSQKPSSDANSALGISSSTTSNASSGSASPTQAQLTQIAPEDQTVQASPALKSEHSELSEVKAVSGQEKSQASHSSANSSAQSLRYASTPSFAPKLNAGHPEHDDHSDHSAGPDVNSTQAQGAAVHAAPAHNVSSLLASYSEHAAVSPQASTHPAKSLEQDSAHANREKDVGANRTLVKHSESSELKPDKPGLASDKLAKVAVNTTANTMADEFATDRTMADKLAADKPAVGTPTLVGVGTSKIASQGTSQVASSVASQVAANAVSAGDTADLKNALFSQGSESSQWTDATQSAKVSQVAADAKTSQGNLDASYTVNSSNYESKSTQPISETSNVYQATSTRVTLTNNPHPHNALKNAQQVKPQGVQAWDLTYRTPGTQGVQNLNEINQDKAKSDADKLAGATSVPGATGSIGKVGANELGATVTGATGQAETAQAHGLSGNSGAGQLATKSNVPSVDVPKTQSLTADNQGKANDNTSGQAFNAANNAANSLNTKQDKTQSSKAQGDKTLAGESDEGQAKAQAQDLAKTKDAKDGKEQLAVGNESQQAASSKQAQNKPKVTQDEDTQALLKHNPDEVDPDVSQAYAGPLHGKAAKIAAYTANAGPREFVFEPRKWLKALCGFGALCVGLLLFIEHEWHVFGWEQPHNQPAEIQQVASTSPYLVDSAVIMPGSDDTDARAAGSLFKNPKKPNSFELIQPFSAAEINEKITIKQLDIERALKHENEGREPSEFEEDCLAFRQTLNNYHALSVQLKPYLASKKTRQELKAAINSSPERIMRFTFPGQNRASLQGWCLVVEDTLGDVEKRKMFVFPTPSARTMANHWIDWYNQKCLTQKHLSLDTLKSYHFETALLDLSILPHNSSLFPYAGQSERAEIRILQGLLNELDHPVGKADGIAGAKTRQEIRKAEKELFTDKDDTGEYEGMDGDVSHALLLFLHFFDTGFDNHSARYM